jgi:hypothetical protein
MFGKTSLRKCLALLVFDILSVASLFESGKVKPNVYEQVWELEDLAKGLDALEKRKTWGKVVVRIRKDTEPARL